jgi:hypothetical protein
MAPLDDNNAVGWQAIDEALQQVYGDQEPIHYATKQPFNLGGQDPLDGISAYKSQSACAHWHFVSYGMSELYAKESDNPKLSGFGIEFTFRLVRPATEQQPPIWVFNLLQNLARYVFKTGNVFGAGHRMDLNSPIALSQATDIRAIAFIQDPQLGAIITPHGHLQFLQVVGITSDELRTMQQWTTTDFLAILSIDNPLLVTDLARKSLLNNPDKAALIHEGMKPKDNRKKGWFR